MGYSVPMSIWTRDIFGRNQDTTPPSAVAVRCARILTNSGMRVMSVILLGYWLGTVLLFGEFALMHILAVANRLGAGGMTPVGTVAPGVPLSNLFRGFPVWTIVGVSGGMVLLAWVLPTLMRRAFDRTIGRRTRAEFMRKRAGRRWARRLGVPVIGFFVVMCVVLGALTSWWAAFIPVVIIGVKLSPVFIAFGVFARRGSRLVCAECDYPMRTWRGASACCTECGNAWRETWGACFGERRIDWRWVAVGSMVIVASLIAAVIVGTLL